MLFLEVEAMKLQLASESPPIFSGRQDHRARGGALLGGHQDHQVVLQAVLHPHETAGSPKLVLKGAN